MFFTHFQQPVKNLFTELNCTAFVLFYKNGTNKEFRKSERQLTVATHYEGTLQ